MEIKSRNKFGVALKVAIVFLAAGYIAWRFSGKQNVDFSFEKIIDRVGNHLFVFFVVIFLMPINWLLESYKWKLIASTKIKISFKEAIQGVLAGVTIGTATPNRVGEFAGRIFMIKEGNRVELLLLSFISSFCQVFVTIVAGIIGFFLIEGCFPLTIPITSFYFLLAMCVVFCTIPFWIKYLPQSWKEKIEVINKFPRKILINAILISTFRYLIYIGQFLILFYVYGGTDFLSVKTCFFLITISYFMVTIIPTFSFTEVFVRGTVAGAVFHAYDDSTFSMAFDVAVLLWTINVAIPSLVGTFFIFKLKFFKSDN